MVVDTALKINSNLKDKSKSRYKDNEIKFVLNSESNSGISKENMEQIRSYLLEYLQKYPKSVYSISLFKFLPSGHEYGYQGRLLVAFKSKFLSDDEERKFLSELNANWIPMWSGKGSMEYIIDGKSVVLNYDSENQNFKIKDDFDHIPSSNFSILGELGIKSIFRYPIIFTDQSIGYLSIYLTEELDSKTEQDLKKISTFLANRLSSYMIDSKGDKNEK